jgi:hypothetical protein
MVVGTLVVIVLVVVVIVVVIIVIVLVAVYQVLPRPLDMSCKFRLNFYSRYWLSVGVICQAVQILQAGDLKVDKRGIGEVWLQTMTQPGVRQLEQSFLTVW